VQELEARIEVRLSNTEDPQKVARAVSNIVKCGEPLLLEHKYGKLMVFKGVGKESLSPLRRLLFEQRILSAARKVLRKNLRGRIFRFYLNKQAAYSGQVSFCEEEGESPLGPVMIELATQDPEALLDWLVPRVGDNELPIG